MSQGGIVGSRGSNKLCSPLAKILREGGPRTGGRGNVQGVRVVASGLEQVVCQSREHLGHKNCVQLGHHCTQIQSTWYQTMRKGTVSLRCLWYSNTDEARGLRASWEHKVRH